MEQKLTNANPTEEFRKERKSQPSIERLPKLNATEQSLAQQERKVCLGRSVTALTNWDICSAEQLQHTLIADTRVNAESKDN